MSIKFRLTAMQFLQFFVCKYFTVTEPGEI